MIKKFKPINQFKDRSEKLKLQRKSSDILKEAFEEELSNTRTLEQDFDRKYYYDDN